MFISLVALSWPSWDSRGRGVRLGSILGIDVCICMEIGDRVDGSCN